MALDGSKNGLGSRGYLMEVCLSTVTSLTSGLVAQRITRLTTDQKIAGSNPAEIEIFHTIFSYKLCCHDKICAPGWARTTNLSVNSRTR